MTGRATRKPNLMTYLIEDEGYVDRRLENFRSHTSDKVLSETLRRRVKVLPMHGTLEVVVMYYFIIDWEI